MCGVVRKQPFCDSDLIINPYYCKEMRQKKEINITMTYFNPSFETDSKNAERKGTSISKMENLSEESNIKYNIGYFKLFRFASKKDVALILLGALSAILRGPAYLLLSLIASDLINIFIMTNNGNETLSLSNSECSTTNVFLIFGGSARIMDGIANFAIRVGILGSAAVCLDFLLVIGMNLSAVNQIFRIRSAYLQAILKQDIEWFDKNGSRDLTSGVSEDLYRIQDAIGEKFGLFLFYCSVIVSSIIGTFWLGWKLSLVTFAAAPLIVLATGFLTKLQSNLIEKEAEAYSVAGGLAEEVIGSIRTVKTFTAEQKEVERFQTVLKPALASSIRRGWLTGLAIGVVWLVNFSVFALVTWYGVKLILESCKSLDAEQYTAGHVIVILYTALDASYKIGQLLPFFGVFSAGQAAAKKIYHILDRVPQIDNSCTGGIHPNKCAGNIRFHRVTFCYPSRPDVTVLSNFSFNISAGQTVAIVGHSGCGKSTCIQLLQRFYDPLHGAVELDGYNIKDVNVRWLRSQIGVVSQEPVLFSTTIAENIRFGHLNASQEDIVRASKLANAHEFIEQLPLGYNTQVGEKGAQLSGGQKQRVAIARALIRDPKILLFDEATSALDVFSEAAVQQALNQARENRTTVIVAHRLSTIENVDHTFVFHEGAIVEQGNHFTLMNKKGLYYQLVISQAQHDQSDGNKDDNNLQHLRRIIGKTQSTKHVKQQSSKTIEKDESSLLRSTTNMLNAIDHSGLKTWFQWNRYQWHWILLAALGSTCVGLSTPLYALLLGELFGVFEQKDNQFIQNDAKKLALMFLGLAFLVGLASSVEHFLFTLTGEKLAHKLRVLSFESILGKDVEWFDRPENSVGSLCDQLHSDPNTVRDASGARIGLMIKTFTSVSVSIVMSLILSWKLGLATLGFAPIAFLSGVISTKMSMDKSLEIISSDELSARILSEAVANIRTVASLGLEDKIHSIYTQQDMTNGKHRSRIFIRALIFGLSNNMILYASIVAYCYGGYLMVTEGLSIKWVFAVGDALIFGMNTIGQTIAFTSTYGTPKTAVKRLLGLISDGNQKNMLLPSHKSNSSKGKVEFDNVHFSYSARSSVPVLKGFSTLIQPGKSLALVGPSGCGKSTCIQLLQRFYKPSFGTISLDDINIDGIPVDALRCNLGVVSQEPVLFNRTIAENITYGLPGNICMEDVKEAARKANIHSFIQSLPFGYETLAGRRGAQLSGGEKQRVAIARALIRNPRVLLLDEATSALDSQSEKIVQEALENASENRTVITIAHRLSTIQKVDEILVINDGRVIESGDHYTLLHRKGFYSKLWAAASSQTDHNTFATTSKH